MTLVLAIALPLVGALVVALVAPAVSARVCGIVATVVGVLAAAAALALAQAFAAGKASLVAEIGPWLPLRGADVTFRLEPALVPVLLVTTGTAAVAFAASLGRPARGAIYSAALVVTGASAALCTASGLLLALAAWEIGALAVYVLLTERAERASAADAARAFLAVTRLTDGGALVASFGILAVFHSVDLREVQARVALQSLIPSAIDALRWSTALLVVAALARAGQLPFSRWVGAIDAPVLTRAIVLGVAAPGGIVLLLRLVPIAPDVALAFGGAVGAATAIVAAAVALAQRDDDRALAWGAVAQLGVTAGALALSPFVAVALLLVHVTSQTALVLAAGSRDDRLTRAATVLGSLASAAFVVTAPLAGRRIARAARARGASEAWTSLPALVLAAAACALLALAPLALPLGVPRPPSDPIVLAAWLAASLTGLSVGAVWHPRLPMRVLDAARDAFGLAVVGRAADALLVVATRPLAFGTERIIEGCVSAAPPGLRRAGAIARRVSELSPRRSAFVVLAVIAAVVVFWILA